METPIAVNCALHSLQSHSTAGASVPVPAAAVATGRALLHAGGLVVAGVHRDAISL